MSLGQAVVDVGADASGFRTDVERQVNAGLQNATRTAQQTMKQVGANLTRTGRNLTYGITLPLIGVGVQAIKTVAQFDSSMNTLQAASGIGDKALGRLRETAIQLGADTVFSANEAADAMLELAKSGLSTSEILKAVPEVMNLAATEGLALDQAAGIVTASLAQFNLEAGDASTVVNALAGAATASRASVEGMGESLKLVGSAAAGIGLSVEETAAALAALSDSGLEGSIAGTSLASVFNHLTPMTTKAKDAMAALNLDFTKADGSFLSIDQIAGKLQDTFKGMDAESRKIALSKIFGNDASVIAAVNALIRSGKGGLQEYTKAAGDTSAASDLADARMEGLSGAIERMKGSLETAALVFGTALKPAIIVAADFIGDLAEKFSQLPPEAQTIIAVIAGIAAVMGPLLLIGGALITSMTAVAGALAAIGLPVILVVAAIAALVAGFIYAYQTSETFRTTVQTALAAVVEFVQTTVIPGLQGIATAFMGLVEAVRPAVMAIVAVIQQNMPQIQETVRSVWESVKTIITSALTIIQQVIVVVTAVIKGIWSAFGDDIMFIVRNVFPALANIIKGSFNIIAGIFKAVAAILKGDWSALWDAIKQILTGVWQVLKGTVRAGLSALLGILRAMGGVVLDLFKNTWNSAKDQTKEAWNALRELVGTAISKLLSKVRELPGKVKEALSGLYDTAIGIGEDLIRGMVQGVKNLAGDLASAAKDAVGGALDGAKGLLGIDSPSKVFMWVGEMTMQGFINGIEARGPKAVEAMVDQLTTLRDKTKEQLDGLRQEFTSLADSISGAFTGNLFEATNVSDFLSGLETKFLELSGVRAALKKLKKWGLDPQFLAQLFASGNTALILDLAEGTRGEARQGAALFEDVGRLAGQLGSDVARNVLGPKIDKTNQKLDQIKDVLKGLIDALLDKKKAGNGAAAPKPTSAAAASAPAPAAASSSEAAVVRELQALRSEVAALTAVTAAAPQKFGQTLNGVVSDARVRAAR